MLTPKAESIFEINHEAFFDQINSSQEMIDGMEFSLAINSIL